MSAIHDCPLASNQHAVIGPLYVTSSIRTAPAKNSNRAPGRPAGWAGERRYNSHHQGCAMDVLARIESVNMYWYVWVCILACILVRIGMY